MNDTIMALASASGKAGIAVVRLSGPQSCEVLRFLSHVPAPPSRKLSLRQLYRHDDKAMSDMLDECLVAWMPGPHSFTGEDIVEFHLHGGTAIVDGVMTAALDTGLVRLAEPGEFSRRAFENDRLDLTKAEAIADLVDAETDAQRRQAFLQYGGHSESIFEEWRLTLIKAMASLEAAIDFPDEEDIPDLVDQRAFKEVTDLQHSISSALENASRGMAIRDGYRVSIIGAPNAGKSTLLNAFAGRDAAIVSDIPGTTRDVLEVRLVLAGYVLWLADTAGIRESADSVEAEGVRRALQKARDSDMRIFVIGSDQTDWDLNESQAGDIVVSNKSDISGPQDSLLRECAERGLRLFRVSAKFDHNLGGLLPFLEKELASRLSQTSSVLVTRRRHQSQLLAASGHLQSALDAMTNGFGAELVSEDLRLAARALGRITGRVGVDDLLDQIFGEFCIGK